MLCVGASSFFAGDSMGLWIPCGWEQIGIQSLQSVSFVTCAII